MCVATSPLRSRTSVWVYGTNWFFWRAGAPPLCWRFWWAACGGGGEMDVRVSINMRPRWSRTACGGWGEWVCGFSIKMRYAVAHREKLSGTGRRYGIGIWAGGIAAIDGTGMRFGDEHLRFEYGHLRFGPGSGGMNFYIGERDRRCCIVCGGGCYKHAIRRGASGENGSGTSGRYGKAVLVFASRSSFQMTRSS